MTDLRIARGIVGTLLLNARAQVVALDALAAEMDASIIARKPDEPEPVPDPPGPISPPDPPPPEPALHVSVPSPASTQ